MRVRAIPPSNLIILRYQLYPSEQIKERHIAASLSTPNHTIVEVIQPSPFLLWGNGHDRKAIFSLAKNSKGNSRGRKGSRRSKIGVSDPEGRRPTLVIIRSNFKLALAPIKL